MKLVTPAVLEKEYSVLSEKIERVCPYVDAVQIDICDGNFTDSKTWPYTGIGPSLEELTNSDEVFPCIDEAKLEVDLMVAQPEKIIGQWIGLGATRIVVHVESTSKISEIISEMKHTYGYDKDFAPGLLSLGLAVSIQTPLSAYEKYLDDIDFIQFMGIATIGKQGQKFDARVLVKIAELRKKYPDQRIQVDGGVSLETAQDLLKAGIDHLVVGSALFGTEDLESTIREFEKTAEQYGRYE